MKAYKASVIAVYHYFVSSSEWITVLWSKYFTEMDLVDTLMKLVHQQGPINYAGLPA